MNPICPFAIQRPGPAVKHWPEMNVVAGVVEHDAGVGSFAGAMQTLDDVTLNAQGEWNSPKSWHFTIDGDGTLYQHYPLTASCWHTGVHAFNARQVGVEHIRPDGRTASVLSGAQLATSVRLARWIASEAGWPQGLLRDVPVGSDQRTLWEHRELFNTTCPEGRIPWAAYTNIAAVPTVPALTQAEMTEAMMVTFGYVPVGAYQRRYTWDQPHLDNGARVYTLRVQP